jgi:hypothetical protein
MLFTQGQANRAIVQGYTLLWRRKFHEKLIALGNNGTRSQLRKHHLSRVWQMVRLYQRLSGAKKFTSLLWFGLFLPTLSLATPLAQDFSNMLDGTAFIRYIKVAVPGELYQIHGKTGKGWVFYEGAFQGDTFWIKNCTNSIPGSGPALPGMIVGASSNENWYARPDGYIAKSPKTVASQEPTDKLVANTLLMVRSAMGLGMPIKLGSLELTNDNGFTAELNDGSKIKGTFVVSQNGRPLKCNFVSENFPKVPIAIQYDYAGRESDSTIPSSFVMRAEFDKSHVEMYEFRILDCVFGKDIPSAGFSPETAFSGTNVAPDSVWNHSEIIFSNSASYQQLPNGKIILVEKSTRLLESHKYLLIALFVCVNAVLLFWLTARARRAKEKQAENNKNV